MPHPKTDVDWSYVLWCNVGRGMTEMEMTNYNRNKITIGFHMYLSTTNYWILQLVFQHDARKKARSISKESNKFWQELDIQDETSETACYTLRVY